MLAVYVIGALITFIWAKSSLTGRDAFGVALLLGILWPLALLLKIMVAVGK